MKTEIPEYQITEQDYRDAMFVLKKIGQTQWELKDLCLQVIRKYAHLSELARTLKWLPAMEDAKEFPETIERESQFCFECELSNFIIYTQLFKKQEEEMHKHLYEVGKKFYKSAVAQCVYEEATERDISDTKIGATELE